MCLLLLAYRVDPDCPLVVAANRDEFHARPTAPASWWRQPRLLAGRDLEAGGTWMGVTRSADFALVTNYRDPPAHRPDARSRGELVVEALQGRFDGPAGRQRLQEAGPAYNSFNLLFGNADRLWYYSDRQGRVEELAPGLYGLSNHLLETAWPKVRRGKQLLSDYLSGPRRGELEPLLALLADRHQPLDHELPNTGVAADWERLLAPMFIVSSRYGTRASTAFLASADGHAEFAERSYRPDGTAAATRRYRFATV